MTAGTIAAVKQNSRLDYGSMAVAMFGISLPNFVLGPLLVLLFSLTLYWFPPARWDGIPSRSMVLPVLTLSAIYMAYIARLARAGMLEVLRSDYIRTARAKGLDEKHVILRHAMRGGLLPVVSFSGPALAILVTGTVVVERIFAHPGRRQLLHQRQPQPRRAADPRHRGVHLDRHPVLQPAGRRRVRVHRPTGPVLNMVFVSCHRVIHGAIAG